MSPCEVTSCDFSLVHSVLMEQVNGHTKEGSFMHGHMLAQKTHWWPCCKINVLFSFLYHMP